MAFTKVVGPGIHTQSNIVSHNINSSGIITATQFDGPFSNIVVGGATTLTVDGINISAGILTAQTLDLNGNGDISGNLVIGGNLTANGDFTTLNTTLREVEILRVDANTSAVAGIITQRGSGDIFAAFDGSTPVFRVADGGAVSVLATGDNKGLRVHSNSGISATNNELRFNTGQSSGFTFMANSDGTSSGEKLRITSDGRIGMGVVSTSANNTCDPDGNQLLIRGPSTFQTNKGHIMLTGDSSTVGQGPQIVFSESGSGANWAGAYIGHVRQGGGSLGDLVFGTREITGDANTVPEERLRIKSDGNVGVGTNNPTVLLHVQNNHATNTKIVVESTGTNSYPAYRVKNDAKAYDLGIDGATDGFRIYDVTGTTERLRITGVGSVGINEDEPKALLHVATDNGQTLPEISASFPLIVTKNSNAGIAIIAKNDAKSILAFGDTDDADRGKIQYVHTSGNDADSMQFITAGGTRWKFDSSGHFLPGTAGAVNIGSATAEIGHVYLASSKYIHFGDNQNLEIHHTNGGGGQSYIKNKTGDLTFLTTDTGEFAAQFRQHSSVDLYYDHSKKFATSGIGVTVFGEVAASQDYPITKPVLDFNFAAEKKLDPRFQFTRESIATFIDKKGIVRYASNNQPRFDHHPTSGVSLGLLLEREQTNHQPYSVDMSQGANNNGVTVENNAAIAPDGTMSASKITGGTNQNTSQRLGWGTQGVASNSYTMWSIWLKSEETSCIIQIYSNTYTFGADVLTVELADGTTGGHNNNDGNFRYNLEKYPNKWWRLSWGGNGNANGNSGGMYVAVVPALNSARAANTGSAHSKVWYAWGLQEEVGTLSRIATSYIPTYGAAVTRKGDRATIDGDDFDDFLDRFQGTVINEHSNALQSYTGGGSAWEFNNDQFQTNIVTQTGSGYAHNGYPGAHASIFGDRGTNGSGNGSGNDYMQAFGPNFADGLNQSTNTGNGRYPDNNIADYTRYYKTWIDGMSYDLTSSTNVLRTASGGEAASDTTSTENISLGNISKFELGIDAGDKAYNDFYGRIKRWVYYDKVVTRNQLANLTSQLPQSYL